MTYDRFADKVGCVPNLRLNDNLYQGFAVAVFGSVGMFAGGAAWNWPTGAMFGAVAGLVTGTLASGLILMFVGLFRRN